MSELKSICVYCGSSNDVAPSYLTLATELGHELAAANIRLVYGGGGVGLMGACARATHLKGGKVLGIMPRFLLQKERIFDEVEHRIVDDMHTRKQMMFDESDAFIVLPGGIGTLEEAVEILSWARLNLHAKPMAFLDQDGFWDPFFELMDHIIDGKFTPEEFRTLLTHADTPGHAIQALQDRCVVV
ncbi:MAG: TIGR00730 family Rossman fold protein [Pseudomonadota bacterium]